MGRKALAVAATVVFAFLAAGAPSASARTVSTHGISTTCWQSIVNDWLDHSGDIKGTYPIPCYRQAIDHLNGYADIQGYSNIIEDIRRAMLYAIQHPGSSSGGGSGGGGAGGGGGGGGGGNGSSTPPSHNQGWITGLADRLSPGNARAIPLPLEVLGALALLLLLGAGGTWLARRMQARRVAPAPVPPERP